MGYIVSQSYEKQYLRLSLCTVRHALNYNALLLLTSIDKWAIVCLIYFNTSDQLDVRRCIYWMINILNERIDCCTTRIHLHISVIIK